MRYDIGLEAESGYIVSAYSGFPVGANRYISISRKRFVKKIQPNERAVADVKVFIFVKIIILAIKG